MPVINTNILSLATQNNLVRSKSGVSTAIERLASGLRINSAKDDSAGSGIANRFTSNIRGYTQAGRNTSDGISLAQTTEGAVSAVNDNVQRIRELTVQAANGTNSQDDLDSIQAEIRQRLDEIDRVAEQTSFNGKKVLNKEESLILQTGVNDNEVVSLNTRIMNTEELGIHYLNVNALESVRPINQAEVNKLTGETSNLLISVRVLPELSSVAIQNFTQEYGLTSDAITTDGRLNTGSDGKVYMKLDVTEPIAPPNDERFKALRLPTNTEPTTAFFVEVKPSNYILGARFSVDNFKVEDLRFGHLGAEGQNYGPNGGKSISAGLLKNSQYGEFPLSILQAKFPSLDLTGVNDPPIITADYWPWIEGNTITPVPGVPSDVFVNNYDLYYANDRFYMNFQISAFRFGDGATNNAEAEASGSAQAALLNLLPGQTIFFDITDVLQAGDFSPDGSGGLFLQTAQLENALSLSDIYVSSDDPLVTLPQAGQSAKTANPLSNLDGALEKIDDYRGELGAVMNRLESSLETISNTRINLEAARSRIRDADYALETSNLTRNQILQQAGTSVLTQANQTPQMVIQLLR